MKRQSGVARTVTRAALARRLPIGVRHGLAYVVALGLLLLVAQLCLAASRVPLRIQLDAAGVSFALDGQSLSLPLHDRVTSVEFVAPPPTVREFQIDGSDSTNNFTEDPTYFAGLASSPYYAFEAWLRDSSSYSSWRDVAAEGYDGARLAGRVALPEGGDRLALPPGARVVVDAALLRPEAPARVELLCGESPCAELVIDRNNRTLGAHLVAGGADVAGTTAQHRFFPTRPLPFAAEALYLLAMVGAWSLVVAGAAALLALNVAWFLGLLGEAGITSRLGHVAARLRGTLGRRAASLAGRWRRTAGARRVSPRRRLPGDRWDALAAVVALCSLGAALYVARVQFAGEPHILDASAYYFQAKIFASGRLAAPAPPETLLPAFQGPFMLAGAGRWFGQYAPATSALLALGMLARAPWAVEPVLGTLALWGIYRIGRLLYSPATGLLALLLGAVSPFYTYLAATYLSHAPALFFAVYFLLPLLAFVRTHRPRDLALAAASAVGLLLCRELVAVLLVGGAGAFLLAGEWRSLWVDRERVAGALLNAAGILAAGLLIYGGYNLLQTGDPFLSPRALFAPDDRLGFGAGVGFYGRNTPAAGFVILDQLLTTLLIDLFGWPFYLTLAFVPFAFLRRSPQRRWDLFCLSLAGLLTGVYLLFYYHGIYLGPRYLFETLPFLLLLTARGMLALPALLAGAARAVVPRIEGARAQLAGRGVAFALGAALCACAFLYYIPRQLQLYADFSGLPYWAPIDVAAVYAFHPANALVLTDERSVYNYVLFPLNDPDLRGPTLYAYAPDAATQRTLRAAYPSRSFYMLQADGAGHVTFVPLEP